LRELKSTGCVKVFREQVSSIGQRAQLEAALEYVREGDTLIVTKLDRLARSARGLSELVDTLHSKGVALRILNFGGGQVFRYFATDGGLAAYGVSLVDQYRRAASYVDRILRGVSPSDLPVQAPDKFELVFNLKTARAQGIDISPVLLARADGVIE
jgi:hypothetical protein